MKNRRPFSSIEQHSGTRILAIILLLIAYGSLYPGNFSAPPAGSVHRFLTDFRWFTSLGDVLGNIALFFPLGMAGVIFPRSGTSGRNEFIVLLFSVIRICIRSSVRTDLAAIPICSVSRCGVEWGGYDLGHVDCPPCCGTFQEE